MHRSRRHASHPKPIAVGCGLYAHCRRCTLLHCAAVVAVASSRSAKPRPRPCTTRLCCLPCCQLLSLHRCPCCQLLLIADRPSRVTPARCSPESSSSRAGCRRPCTAHAAALHRYSCLPSPCPTLAPNRAQIDCPTPRPSHCAGLAVHRAKSAQAPSLSCIESADPYAPTTALSLVLEPAIGPVLETQSSN